MAQSEQEEIITPTGMGAGGVLEKENMIAQNEYLKTNESLGLWVEIRINLWYSRDKMGFARSLSSVLEKYFYFCMQNSMCDSQIY